MGNFYNWLQERRASAIAQDADFKEEDHPRNDKGGSGGGRFRTSGKTIEKEDSIGSSESSKDEDIRLWDSLPKMYAHASPITGGVSPRVTFYPNIADAMSDNKGNIVVVTDLNGGRGINHGEVEVVGRDGKKRVLQTSLVNQVCDTGDVSTNRKIGRQLLKMWGVEEPKEWTLPYPQGYEMGSLE